MSTRGEKLVKNASVITLGNIGSKLLQFLLVPFYARVMNSEEFGTVDILQSIVSLVLPIVSLSVFEAVFRFSMEKKYDKDKVISNGLYVTVIGCCILCICSVPAVFFIDATYVWLVLLNTIAVAYWTLFSQYTKAIGRTVLFSINSVILTCLVLFFSILFLYFFKLGIYGYMMAYIIANLIATIILIPCLRKDYNYKAEFINHALLTEMLVFSIPLVLNGICWWLSNFTDRVMITLMLGTSVNGLYAASSKIPHLISVMALVFLQAWQISANEEYDSYDKADFYGTIYEGILGSVFFIASVIILLCKPLTSIVLGQEFYSSWKNMPVLVIAAVAFSLSAFFISIYTACKKTKMAFYTNLICVIVNLICNYFFIKMHGALGAAVATALAYIVLWIVRVYDVKRIISINCHVGKTIVSYFMLIASSILVIFFDSWLTYLFCSLVVFVLVLIYRLELKNIIAFIFRFVLKYRKIKRKDTL